MDFVDNITKYYNKEMTFENKMKSFKEMIKYFFMVNQNDIKNIYTNLKENNFPHNTIAALNLNLTIHLFDEYLEGLNEFMEVVLDIQDGDNVSIDAVNDRISMVSDKSDNYIRSIFGGDNNKYTKMDLDDAMSQIEYSIDILSIIDQYIIKVNNLSSRNDYNTEEIKDVKKSAINAYCNLIEDYLFTLITEIFKTFKNITDSMNNRTPVGGNKEVPTMQIF